MDTRPAAPDIPAPRHDLDLPVLVARTHALLEAGVPLTLLLDLAAEDPRSQDRYAAEGGDVGWIPGRS